MSKIIGIHYGGHDSAVALVVDGEVVCAIEEEKLTGIKARNEFWKNPTLGLDFLNKNFNANFSSVDHIVFALPRHMRIEHENINNSHKFDSYSHHKCHALGSYYTSGMEGKVIAMSHDGQGQRVRGKVYLCEDGNCEQVHEQPTSQTMSLAGVWGKVTELLGWKMFKDEGKVVGMVSHGKFDQTLYNYLKQCFYYDGNLNFGPSNGHAMFDYIFTENLVKQGYLDSPQVKNDLAFTLQQLSEESFYLFMKDLNEKYPEYRKITMSGGVFANVKLNQFINKLDFFDEIYVHQSMGDGGLALGAALSKAAELGEITKPLKPSNVFYGSKHSKEDWDILLSNYNDLISIEPVSFEKIGWLVNDGFVVGVFVGRTEYGPRALGNRSIICKPTDRNTHRLLNEKLNRTEIMPFAPSIMEEHFDKVFVEQKSKYTAQFMTLCYDTKPEWQKIIPAVVHEKDGTARPQIVSKENNPHFYNIINEYYKLSGIPVVLNTSFNAHGEPINNYPSQVINHLLNNSVDYIVTEDYIISKKK